MKKQTDNGGSAFPWDYRTTDCNGCGIIHYEEGMTLRDWFAGQALAGICANPNTECHLDILAKSSFEMADAMLDARKQTEC